MSVSAEGVREVVGRVAFEEGLRLVVLFGSTARGEDRAEDLDLALLGTGPLDLVRLTNVLMQRTGVQEIDLVDLRRADSLLMMLVARDGIPLFEETPGEFTSFWSLAARRYADGRKFRDAQRESIRDFVRRQGSDP
jgi:predicted nucleotidyltransferase